MGFFDLNIPYVEADRHIADKKSAKAMRLKLIIKAMELGYTGVAYNRTIKGVMSETDRCSIPLFPLSSILKLSPSISSAAKLHRGLLNVPVSSPFRQYTRLTVTVDSPAQASVLNSGNPITKSYNVVAVMPLNQNAFDQACQISEVDIITIDFSRKTLFRLKQPMVQAAVQRGVYFEITYSSLLIDAQTRRQMISNVKLLVNWTRGRNIILTSSAPSVSEFRGPYDIVNLSFLLGLSSEHAKAAISKNCRTLMENSLRKKLYYKEAIKVEAIPSAHSVRSIFDDWLKWDPISSGDGDLLLDDIDKLFSDSSDVSQIVKPIDFTSAMNGLPTHGLEIRDVISSSHLEPKLLDDVSHFPAYQSIDNGEEKEEHMISERISSDSGVHGLNLESDLSKSEGQETLLPDNTTTISNSLVDAVISSQHSDLTSAKIYVPAPLPLEKSDTLNTSHAEESPIPGILDSGLHPRSAAVDEIVKDMKDLSEKEPSLVCDNVDTLDDFVETEEIRDNSVNPVNELPMPNSNNNPMQNKNECKAAETELMEAVQIRTPSPSGRKGHKKALLRPFLFPFKRMVRHRYLNRRKASRRFD
ncbi:unnamed protein product [Cuscuta europaea]|uniref:Uncharacterized protein n=1 Tax=Cuscuta europaea TaxID=41803 RepID=A0A9P0ZBU9_CUSEU|nr:unnamed protein product [Cuscuta europaea]